MVPSTLRQLLAQPDDCTSRPSKIRTVVVGGANLDPDLIVTFRKIFPDCQLLNIWGSSETGHALIGSDRSTRDNASDASRPACSEYFFQVISERTRIRSTRTLGTQSSGLDERGSERRGRSSELRERRSGLRERGCGPSRATLRTSRARFRTWRARLRTWRAKLRTWRAKLRTWRAKLRTWRAKL
jgi:acyl-CoA synthetase (AMP-forming)/AMP-acid ligase II